ncbi:MAG: agmatinase [Anaerolineales bacterium]|nr:agmatinase [Anaerolineales bacterium]
MTNLAFGAHQQPFSGITTFMCQPATRDLTGVDVAIVGIPYDSGTSYRSGTRFGPRKIREASLMVWGHNPIMQVTPLKKLNLVDWGDVDVIPVDIQATMKSITEEVGEILAQDVKVISLGGDHSIALPLLRAHAAKHGPLAIVHFDSHPDMWNREYNDTPDGRTFPYSHGTPFIRAMEEGLIDREAYMQIGIRGPVSGPEDYADAIRLGADMITIGKAFEMGIPAIIEAIHAKMGSRKVYVTLDIDATDPAYAPGTGTPEVGGFTSFQMLQMVRGLKGLNLIGFDLVEVNPQYDHGDITALLAANLVFEFLSLLAI